MTDVGGRSFESDWKWLREIGLQFDEDRRHMVEEARKCLRSDQSACMAGSEPGETETLPAGEYRVIVTVHVSEDVCCAEWLFVIGTSAETTSWARSLPSRR